ncbi:hypothetical protein BT93_K1474 [Corymbia citriodora subsp. variegata]|nr:hypothetical protein BT93_K1474 [Corymbia citriodora subsp. variegata]
MTRSTRKASPTRSRTRFTAAAATATTTRRVTRRRTRRRRRRRRRRSTGTATTAAAAATAIERPPGSQSGDRRRIGARGCGLTPSVLSTHIRLAGKKMITIGVLYLLLCLYSDDILDLRLM